MTDVINSGYAFGGEMPDWLAARAALMPDRVALVASGACLAFAELDRRVSATARRLSGLGIVPGDRVATLLGNGVPAVELAHAAGRAGAVLVPLNTRLTPDELAWQVADVRACLLVFDHANREKATRTLRLAHHQERFSDAPASAGFGHPLVGVNRNRRPTSASAIATEDGERRTVEARGIGTDELDRLPESNVTLPGRIDLAAIHTIVYTSGTTGRPKGAVLTYGNHWWSAIGSALNLGLRDDDRWLAALPLFHVGGLSILMRSVIYGITAVVHDGFDPAAANHAIDREGVTAVSAVATMLARMLDQQHDEPYPPSLRFVLLGGGPAPLPLLERCGRAGVPVVQTYGLTETASQCVTLPPADALRKVGSAGKPLLPNELRIERDGVPAGPNEAGEIVIRGPTVTPGYAGRPDETAQALRDGWLHTGDIGSLDDEGYLYVLDRRDDLIVSGGENVYPAEVEAALEAHPLVAEAGVKGEADATWGAVPVAFVALRAGATTTPDELIAFCGERLARYKVPRRISVVGALPRNAAGKLQRNRLGT